MIDMKYIVEADEEDSYFGEYAVVYRIDKQGNKTEVGWIGSEPEDNTHYRAYSWIEGALNEAYQLGVKDGARKEYDRLRDKV